MDKPIIFSGPMIRALLDGRKTMTRRMAWREFPKLVRVVNDKPRRAPSPWQRVRPGDRLWVRESWSLTGEFSDATSKYLRGFYSPERVLGRHLRHRADADGYDEASQAWRPSIHMPRWASRLTLTVTATKIERLQEISEADAQAEGIAPYVPDDAIQQGHRWYRMNFEDLWNALHGAKSWDANPEVVALTFAVEKRNIGAGTKAVA